jgi:hypothetical protein
MRVGDLSKLADMTGLVVPDASESTNLLPIEPRPVRRPFGLTCLFVLSFLGLNGPACAGVTPDPAQAVGQDFAIAVGATARISQTDLVVHFDRVVNDSRCPSDVQCISAGDATVAVTAESEGAAARRYELHTDAGAREVMHGNFRLSLIGLKPFPTSTRPVPESAYVLTLRVSQP